MCAASLLTRSSWVLLVIAVGFALRVASGPRFSPLARVAVMAASRLGEPRLVPGAPKRFAQSVGLVVSGSAAVLGVAGFTRSALALVALLLVFASLEAFVGFCAGCFLFGRLVRAGVVGEQACAACADLSVGAEPATS